MGLCWRTEVTVLVVTLPSVVPMTTLFRLDKSTVTKKVILSRKPPLGESGQYGILVDPSKNFCSYGPGVGSR